MEVTMIGNLVDALQRSNIAELQLTGSDYALRLTRSKPVRVPVTAPTATVAETPGQIDPTGHAMDITATRPGFFQIGHPSLQDPYLTGTQTVRAGDILGLICYGPFFSVVRSATNGIVSADKTPSGCPVSYGEQLFTLTETHRTQP